jgi:hypothetical protein
MWRHVWVGQRGPLPQLHFERRDGQTGIVDTRSGIARFHSLNHHELSLLDAFREPELVARVQKGAVVPEGELLAHLSHLVKKQLLFVEGGRGVSLVLQEPTEVPAFVNLLRSGEVVLH